MTSFVPALHLDTAPAEKLKPEWCLRAIQYYYHNTTNFSLLEGKNVGEIEEYASGEINMKPFRRMYTSLKRKEMKMRDNNVLSPDEGAEMQFTPLPLIVTPLNSATEIIHKVPVEVSCTALDPLAATKKKEDVTFLKNKPQVENDLKQVTDQMGISPLDIGATKHSAIPFSDSPYGLNLNEPDEFDVFVNLIYRLGVESCFETILQTWFENKSATLIKLLEIRDQMKYGISTNSVSQNSLTGLPDIRYEYPGEIFTPFSQLPDFSDNTHRYQRLSVTPMDLFDMFGSEICDQQTLEDIVVGSSNDDGYSYCSCNGYDRANITGKNAANFNTYKMSLIRFEVKSIDWVGKMSNPKSKKGFTYLSTDISDNQTCTGKIWGQNTYVFYWLLNTHKFFGIHRLGYAHRTVGMESYQNFSTNIYRSQYKSAVECSIGENKKAQRADIKLQYAIIQARPSGVYIDLKYLRTAIQSLTEESTGYSIDQLIETVMERNIMIGDSTGMDGVNEAQFKPFQEIVGGLRNEVEGFLRVILSAQQNIASFTGINQALTGQSQDPNSLIGIEKMRINSSLNALHYANTAIEVQYQRVFNQWAYCFKEAIKRGGKTKEAVANIIGSKKVDIIDRLQEVPLHSLGVKITLNLREEERSKYEQRVYKLESQGVLTSADIYMLDYIPNIKDRWALLAVKENQFMKRQDRIRQENYANQQQLAKQQGDNLIGQEQAATDGEIKKVYAQGDVKSKLASLQSQLNAPEQRNEALLQKSLTSDRTQGQIQKALQTLQAKADLDNQKAF
jgi:hypothetical protein